MGMFDKLQKTASKMGSTISKTAGRVGSSAALATQEQAELVSLRSEINVINQELEAAYTQIGRKYVDYVVTSGEMPGIDVSDILTLIEPKMAKKQDLEKQIITLEKEIKTKDIMREKAAAEEAFLAEKTKLDRALAMDLLTQEEYDAKLATARKRVDNFELIRKIEQQAEMGLITAEEKAEKLKAILE